MPPNGIDGSLDRGKLRKTSSGNEVTLSISCMLIRAEAAQACEGLRLVLSIPFRFPFHPPVLFYDDFFS